MSSRCRASHLGMEFLTPATFIVSGRVTRAGVPHLCSDLEAILATSDATVVDCDVGGIVQPDLVSVEAIARLSLVARRSGGRQLRLLGTRPEFQHLLDLVGLGEVIEIAEAPSQAEAEGVGPGLGKVQLTVRQRPDGSDLAF
nr:STAS domain-containing protein [Streptomyces sp. RKAG290]